MSTELYPLQDYKVTNVLENEKSEGTYLAPSPLVAAFLHSPYGMTWRSLVVEMVEPKPEIGPYDHDMLEAFIREHFMFREEPYSKLPIEEVFLAIEKLMEKSLRDPTVKAGEPETKGISHTRLNPDEGMEM
jgi:hypothetical protein